MSGFRKDKISGILDIDNPSCMVDKTLFGLARPWLCNSGHQITVQLRSNLSKRWWWVSREAWKGHEDSHKNEHLMIILLKLYLEALFLPPLQLAKPIWIIRGYHELSGQEGMCTCMNDHFIGGERFLLIYTLIIRILWLLVFYPWLLLPP